MRYEALTAEEQQAEFAARLKTLERQHFLTVLDRITVQAGAAAAPQPALDADALRELDSRLTILEAGCAALRSWKEPDASAD